MRCLFEYSFLWALLFGTFYFFIPAELVVDVLRCGPADVCPIHSPWKLAFCQAGHACPYLPVVGEYAAAPLRAGVPNTLVTHVHNATLDTKTCLAAQTQCHALLDGSGVSCPAAGTSLADAAKDPKLSGGVSVLVGDVFVNATFASAAAGREFYRRAADGSLDRAVRDFFASCAWTRDLGVSSWRLLSPSSTFFAFTSVPRTFVPEGANLEPLTPAIVAHLRASKVLPHDVGIANVMLRRIPEFIVYPAIEDPGPIVHDEL